MQNRVGRAPLVPVALVHGVGCAAGSLLPSSTWPWWAAALVLGLLSWALVFRQNQQVRTICLWLLLFVAGATAATLQRHPFRADHLTAILDPDPQWLKLRGTVASLPILSGPSDELDKEGDPDSPPSARAEFILDTTDYISPGLPPRPLSGKVSVRTEGSGVGLIEQGDFLEVEGLLIRPSHALNPGAFDPADYLASRRVSASLKTSGQHSWKTVNKPRWSPAPWASRARAYMRRALGEGLGDPVARAVLAGMLYGDRTDFGDDLRRAFRETGTMHLFAVSGQNVAVLAGVGALLLRLFGLLRWRWGVALIPPLWLYVLATGAQPSAVRAGVMASLLLVAWRCDRPLVAPNLLAAAAFIILLTDPAQCLDLGFLLSFSVVASLVWISPLVFNSIKSWSAPDPFLPRELWPAWVSRFEPLRLTILATVAASVGAFIGSAPLSWWCFHLVSPIALAVNVPVAFLASAIVAVGAGSLSLFWVWPTAAGWCNLANAGLVKVLLAIIALGHAVPGGSFHMARPREIWESFGTSVQVLSVGDGQAILVQGSSGVELFDCGSTYQCATAVEPFLRFRGINHLVRLWLSQGDYRHIGGAASLMHAWRIEEIVRTGLSTRSSTLRSLEKDYPARTRRLFAGDIIQTNNRQWTVLWPPHGFPGDKSEEKSLVTLLEIGGARILFANDLGSLTESQLVDHGSAVQADVLVQGPNGNNPGLSPRWLDAIQPQLVLFNGGGYRRHTLSPSQLRALKDRGIPVFDLQNSGTASLSIHQGSIEAKFFASEKRLTLSAKPADAGGK